MLYLQRTQPNRVILKEPPGQIQVHDDSSGPKRHLRARLVTKDWPSEGDPKALFQFCALIVVLGGLMAIAIPAAGRL